MAKLVKCPNCKRPVPIGASGCVHCGRVGPFGETAPATALQDPNAILFQIGDIGISATSIFTPNGVAPLAGSQWIVRDLSRTETRIPSLAIFLAIVFSVLCCLLGLLFLAMKETIVTGYIEVSVQQGRLHHVTQIRAGNASFVASVRDQVRRAQMMAAAASLGSPAELDER